MICPVSSGGRMGKAAGDTLLLKKGPGSNQPGPFYILGSSASSCIAASSQSTLFSEQPGGHSSNAPLLLRSPTDPLRWARLGARGYLMAFSWTAGGASVPAGQAPPGALRAGFNLPWQVNCPGHQGFAPLGQNACTAQSAAPSLTGPRGRPARRLSETRPGRWPGRVEVSVSRLPPASLWRPR